MQPRSKPPDPTDDDAGGGGVTLRRLLTVAGLTPAQAALLVSDVIHQLEPAGSQGRFPVRLEDRAVTVSDRGLLTIECSGSAASWHDAHEVAVGLLRDIASTCRDAAFADRLRESITGTTDLAGLTQRVCRVVAAELDPATGARTRRQLAELVSATRGLVLSDDRVPKDHVTAPMPPPQAAESSLAPSDWHPPAGRVWHRRSRRPSWRQGVLGVISILVLIGLLWTAPQAWSQLRRGWDAVLHPTDTSEQNQIRPVSPPPPAPEAAPPPTEPGATGAGPVHTGLPSSAGPITRVTATFANGECAAGAPCTMRVDVHLDPGSNVGAVTWKLSVYDRCSGAVHPGADVTMPVPPGGQEVYGIGTAVLPAGSALAVAALTSAPAGAASEPAYVPAENATCPGGGPHAGG
ncbi:hypothetical protein GCM10023094_09160 [Rhodococcus olei]|uniref:Uncharacterized protein n=1 Tax=Rhodococcus olei TaxID=2161675 RepID=A0ABP8NUT2_9NOCA